MEPLILGWPPVPGTIYGQRGNILYDTCYISLRVRVEVCSVPHRGSDPDGSRRSDGGGRFGRTGEDGATAAHRAAHAGGRPLARHHAMKSLWETTDAAKMIVMNEKKSPQTLVVACCTEQREQQELKTHTAAERKWIFITANTSLVAHSAIETHRIDEADGKCCASSQFNNPTRDSISLQ